MAVKESWKHIEILNREMGEVRTDIKWIKEKLNKHDMMLAFIFTGVIISILTEILIKVI